MQRRLLKRSALCRPAVLQLYGRVKWVVERGEASFKVPSARVRDGVLRRVEFERPEQRAQRRLCMQLVQSETVANLCVFETRCALALQSCSACPEVVRLVQMEEARFDRQCVQRAERGSGAGGPRALDGGRAVPGGSVGVLAVDGCDEVRGSAVSKTLASKSRCPQCHGGWGMKRIASRCRAW